MLSQRRLVGTFLIGTTTVLLAFACGDDKEKSSCVTGDERCACYPNGTCNNPDELVCLSNLCVSTTAGGRDGTGGADANTGGAATGKGGTGTMSGEGGVGDAGPTSSGGSAGADAGGSTGVDPTGGTTATGGKTSSKGGSTGTTGGATGTTGGASTTSGGVNGGAGEPGEGGTVGEGGATTSPDGNMISNGDFSGSNADWNVTFGTGTLGVSTFTNGHACVQGDPSTTFNLGWPLDTSRAFVLEPGVPYTLSFRAVAGSEFTLVIKLGHVTSPYTAAYLTNTPLTTSWKSYSFDVVAASGDSAAGLVFQGTLLSGNSACFDDVALVKN